MSRKTEFKGTAASRRRARRANLQSQERLAPTSYTGQPLHEWSCNASANQQ